MTTTTIAHGYSSKPLPFFLLISLFIFASPSLSAQKNKVEWLDNFCTPGLSGMAPSRGISIEQSNAPEFRMRSKSLTNSEWQGTDHVENQRRLKLKVRAPLWNSDGLKAVIGVRYETEQLVFEDDAPMTLTLHQSLERKTLRNMASELLVLKPFRGKDYLVFRGSLGFSGEFDGFSDWGSDYLHYSLSALWGHKKNDRTEIGAGLSFNNSLGIINVIPVLLYNHNFNDKWGLEALLPKKAQLRYNISERQLLSLIVEGDGGNYFIPDAALSERPNEGIRMNITEIKAGLSYQREIFSLLWGSVDVGYRKNLSLDFARSDARRNDNLYESFIPGGLFASFSLFIIPPKKK